MKPIILNPKQQIAWDKLTDNSTNSVIYGGAAGGGKSYLGCLWLIAMALQYPETRWLLGRYEYKKLLTTSYKTLLRVLTAGEEPDNKGVMRQVGMELLEGEDFVCNLSSNNPHIKFPNGSEIVLVHFQVRHSDPDFDRLGSLEITGAFVDELAEIQYRAWSVLMGRIRYRLDEYGLIPKRMGTCNPTNTFVKPKYYEPWKNNALANEDAFIQATYEDNTFLSKTYGGAINQMDAVDKRRYLGDWEFHNDASNLFTSDKLNQIFTANAIENPKSKWYITCDVARFGADLSVIMVWDGMNVVQCDYYEKNTISDLVAKIKELQVQYGIPPVNVIVDTDGVGGGVTDGVGATAFHAGAGFKKQIRGSQVFTASKTAIKRENYANLKAQCFHIMAMTDFTFQPNGIVKGKSLHEYIKDELRVISSISNEKKVDVTKKDKIKELIGRSPDFADTIAMRGFFELRRLAVV